MEFARNQKYTNIMKSTGSATTEFLISLAFFVPLFITVPVIGKYIAFKQKNIESNRYAVWERTVWSDEDGLWNDVENSKGDETIAIEVDRRFYGSQIQGMASKQITDSNLWVDRNHQAMLTLESKGKQRISVLVGQALSPINNYVADNLAYDGLPDTGGVLENITGLFNTSMGNYTPNCHDFPGVDFNNGMNLGSKTYASINVSANMTNLVPLTSNSSTEKKTIHFTSSGTILSNAWTAPTEAIYKERVGKLAIDDAVRCIVAPASLISRFPVYKEGRAASNVASGEKTTVLPEDYKL